MRLSSCIRPTVGALVEGQATWSGKHMHKPQNRLAGLRQDDQSSTKSFDKVVITQACVIEYMRRRSCKLHSKLRDLSVDRVNVNRRRHVLPFKISFHGDCVNYSLVFTHTSSIGHVDETQRRLGQLYISSTAAHRTACLPQTWSLIGCAPDFVHVRVCT